MNKMRMNKKLTNISHGSFLLGFVFNMHLLRITMADHNNRENITTMELQKQLSIFFLSSSLFELCTNRADFWFVLFNNLNSFINFMNTLYTKQKLLSTLGKMFLNFFWFYGIIYNFIIVMEYLYKPVFPTRIHFILGNQ